MHVYRYQNGRLEKKEIAKKKIEHDQSGKKLWEEEISRRREQLFQDSGREMERRERERRLLVEYGELHKFTQIKNANEIRKNLDKQCVSKKKKPINCTIIIKDRILHKMHVVIFNIIYMQLMSVHKSLLD
jgi:hypothetical protein